MKKFFKIQYNILACLLLLASACNKDGIEQPEIPKDNDRDIRILKVQYMGHDYDANHAFDGQMLMSKKECRYHYDANGDLSYITNDNIRRVQVEYRHEQIIVSNSVKQDQLFSSYWDNSVIDFKNKSIENIIATTRYLSIEPSDFTVQDKIAINRTTDGRLKSVLLESSPDAPIISSTLYYGLATKVLTFNENGLPDKIETPFFYWSEPDYYTADFAFQYSKADDIPTKLKRLVNEELLFLNRFGLTNLDLLYIDSTRNFSQFGEGNWLISFGFPQHYILEEESTYLVSKRKTNFYKGGINEDFDPDGSKIYLKTIEQDFPYIHDSEAKTLEIAGLKIWYEFVE